MQQQVPLVRAVPVIAVVTTLLALLAAALTTPAGAAERAASPSYVALGDSYASGTGTRSYLADGTSCQRSTRAYPALIAAARGYELSFRACSGARVSDVATQVEALSPATGYVTVSVGGNDAGFADVLTECAQPGWMSDCNGAIDAARRFIDRTLPGRLAGLYADIDQRAPNARVVVVGYPRIFMGKDCNWATWFSRSEMTRLNETADLLNQRTAGLAATRGFGFADPTDRFVGHAVCADAEWINGLSWPISESYHPNRPGHSSGYTPTVSPLLTGAAVAVSRTVRQRAAASAERLVEAQREHTATDAAIEPETVAAPDLTTPRARKAARRAGVDLGSRRSIDAADRRASRAQARAWARTH
ncbi:SGNH/GDSL hydrolase family protein [Nocardioides donggukensis]|uniref:SGNH/GDSL hydrolase family protein n=1 Tax=Nocardioides donggukensis TaxID=2774019 RepID=A0A927Q417_9ACTN|nr:SGNH/GDSL hydrolase family protein [Nocardioides donggukensis]MBD8871096.1 SGNH/GDSL hydrolase family protein [Nocardioides donggukensis]